MKKLSRLINLLFFILQTSRNSLIIWIIFMFIFIIIFFFSMFRFSFIIISPILLIINYLVIELRMRRIFWTISYLIAIDHNIYLFCIRLWIALIHKVKVSNHDSIVQNFINIEEIMIHGCYLIPIVNVYPVGTELNSKDYVKWKSINHWHNGKDEEQMISYANLLVSHCEKVINPFLIILNIVFSFLKIINWNQWVLNSLVFVHEKESKHSIHERLKEE